MGMQLSRIGEQLRESGNSKDPFAVAVVRSSVTSKTNLLIGTHVVLEHCTPVPMATYNKAAKIISAKFSIRPISLENLALYGTTESLGLRLPEIM